MTLDETALVMECEGSQLVGVLSRASSPGTRGVLIVVGGPQYRVGSHRQFTLLCRILAGRGVPALRFDYRGMGDSDGETRTFERVGEDIRCAIDRLFAEFPGLKDVVIWGLCDAASAALFYAHGDPRVSGLVLLNPWVRTEEGLARLNLRHYYLGRLFQASLWQKIARGDFDLSKAAATLGGFLIRVLPLPKSAGAAARRGGDGPLPERMADGLDRFRGKVLLILSGADLTAKEFKDVVARSERWRALLEDARVTRRELVDANHTFARRAWRDEVAQLTENWMRSF